MSNNPTGRDIIVVRWGRFQAAAAGRGAVAAVLLIVSVMFAGVVLRLW
jgi:hypothetical protein